ncbi:GroES-like protein [Macrolepiota fuliginosa MF-IS2]|uniref:GroES-like protein n=1 Tax=Macrolepiota fuliginosa MF-IS2 TaxID=1400762 RepID=A0A9P5XD86_9AGAR|nr:GroES-like protein [Macrolepiota fuliginosa MF-IS2]
MKALTTAKPDTTVVADVPLPEPQAGEIRIRVHSVALNPVDALYVAHPLDKGFGRIIGSDFAGTVEKLGEGVVGWSIGDRAAGLLQGACSVNLRPGAFAEYAILEADLAIHVPANVSFDEAATLPLCSLTAVQMLFIRLGLPIPFPTTTDFPTNYPTKPTHVPTILVYSASTSVGLYILPILQYMSASHSDFKLNIIAIGSAQNHAKFASLGAHHSFDYRDPDWEKKVLEVTDGGAGIDYAVDCLSEGESVAQISRLFRPAADDGIKKTIAVVQLGRAWGAEDVRKDVETRYGTVWTCLGHDIVYNSLVLPSPASHRQLAVDFFRFLSSGSRDDPSKFSVTPNPVRLMPGGLDDIPRDGFTLLGSGLVVNRVKSEKTKQHMRPISAEKLVYRIYG